MKVTLIWILGLAASFVAAEQARLSVELSHPLMEANKKQTAYVKVGLTGFEMERGSAPVNVALVLDKSGSMQGSKLAQAKNAAIAAIARLRDQDIISVITYDSTVEVVIPATRVSDRDTLYRRINAIGAGGSTALFAGVSKGAAELRKFLDPKRVNRVILLSDGLANIGPSSPGELSSLGRSLAKDGIAVTTIGLGLGYNEDLMAQLAGASDGTHAFVESPKDLKRIFDLELKDVMEVVAQEVVIEIKCAQGVRPVRVLGREAEINGQQVVASLNQLYSKQEKYVLLEVEIPAVSEGKTRELVDVEVSYANMSTQTTDTLTSKLSGRFSNNSELVEKEVNGDVMVAAVAQISNERNRKAVALRDAGRVEEARRELLGNASYLSGNSKKYKSEQLKELQQINDFTADNLDDANWGRSRKDLRHQQNKLDNQQRY